MTTNITTLHDDLVLRLGTHEFINLSRDEFLEITQQRMTVEELTDENADLRKEVSDLEDEITALEDENADLESQIAELKAEIEQIHLDAAGAGA